MAPVCNVHVFDNGAYTSPLLDRVCLQVRPIHIASNVLIMNIGYRLIAP